MTKETSNVTLPMKLLDKVDEIVEIYPWLYDSRAQFVKEATRELIKYHEFLEEKKLNHSKRVEKSIESRPNR